MSKVIISPTIGMKGFFRLRTVNKFSGKTRIDTGWFPNKILDSGRNIMSTEATWMDSCQVGTDNTAPSAVQTALLGYVAGTTDVQSTTSGTQSVEPYFGWKRRTFRFPAGSVAANLTEAGVGWGTSGSTLISRALIIDPITQNPTTVTPLADEMLDVTYELRYYPPLEDVLGPQVVLDGVTYDTITRAASVTGGRWSADIGNAIGQYSPDGTYFSAYDGDIGTILTGPSGLFAYCDNANQFNSAYSNNSYEQQINSTCGATGWNLAAGIRSLSCHTTAGSYQTQFNAVGTGNRIPKTTNYAMTVSWTLNWAEKL